MMDLYNQIGYYLSPVIPFSIFFSAVLFGSAALNICLSQLFFLSGSYFCIRFVLSTIFRASCNGKASIMLKHSNTFLLLVSPFFKSCSPQYRFDKYTESSSIQYLEFGNQKWLGKCVSLDNIDGRIGNGISPNFTIIREGLRITEKYIQIMLIAQLSFWNLRAC